MTTQAQLDANRQNAQKSTGPKTPEGKAVAAQNSATHGLTANTPVIAGEDPADYAQFRSQLRGEMNPKGPMEIMLSDRIIQFIRTKYQSLLMDHADYDDCEIREITESLKTAGQ